MHRLTFILVAPLVAFNVGLAARRPATPAPQGLWQALTTMLASPTGTIYAATALEFLVSRDGGVTWRAASSCPSINSVQQLVTDPLGCVYAIDGDGRLYGTFDESDSWIEFTGEFDTGVVLRVAVDPRPRLFTPRSPVYAQTATGAIFSSPDGGEHWERIDPALPGAFLPAAFASTGALGFFGDSVFVSRAAGDPCHGALVAHGCGIVRGIVLDDAGGAFVNTDSMLLRTGDFRVTWDTLVHRGFGDVEIDSAGGVLAAAGDSGLWRSTDRGMTWRHIFDDTSDWHVYRPHTVSVEANGVIFFGTFGYGSMYRSADLGATWTQLYEDLGTPHGIDALRISALVSTKQCVLLAATSDGLYRSYDHDTTWTRLDIGSPNYGPGALAMTSTDHVIAATPTAVYRSTNQGDTWEYRGVSPEDSSVDAMLVDDSDHVWTMTGSGVFRSNDEGLTWTRCLKWSQVNFEALALGPHHTVYLGGFTQLNMRSTDDGNSWHNLAMPDSAGGVMIISILPEERRIYLGTIDGLFTSRDDGATWRRSTDPTVGHAFVWTILRHADSALYISAIEGIFRSTNDGATWTRLIGPCSQSKTVFATDCHGNLISTRGDGGIGLVSRGTTTAVAPAIIPSAFALPANFPNPVNPTTTITFVLDVEMRVRLDVCDALGRCVATLANGVAGAGKHLVAWNAADVPKGVYFARLLAGTRTGIGTMVVAR